MHVRYCQVCQSATGNLHLVREMMLGTRDQFLYYECSECGCLSLAEVPENLGQYYPQDYCKLKTRPPSVLRMLRNALYLSRCSFLVNWRKRNDLDVIRRVHLKKNMTFLEVGGKSDSLPGDLRELGYDAHGVNLFVHKDVEDRHGVRVERKTLAEVKGKFDVILFRHSLEHMPIDMLRQAREHIKSNGSCVVCIPVLGWAWQTYATDWAELDAPRHLFVHTNKSFSLLAEKSGFRIDKVVFDSTEFQFWASNWYQRNVPLVEMPQPTRQQRSRMRHLAEALNLIGKGDTAQFYLKPA
jgi:predicted SAM-dependent methyltransferase